MNTIFHTTPPHIILSQPKRLVPPYSWVGHIPFAFWLVNKLKPSSIVELGTHTGNSYFSFCQAVEESGISSRCIAIDTWRGDEHAGFYGDTIYSAVLEYNNQNYQDFSTLLRSTFDDALTQVDDASIDILHIDGLHTYEAVKHDFDTWLPKLSKHGIVLLHDIQVRERGFGVWKLWQQLRTTYPSFEFTHSSGLGALGIGKDLPDAAIELFSLKDQEVIVTQTMFSRLGSAIQYEAELEKAQIDTRDREDGISWLKQQVESRDHDISWLKQQLETRDKEITQLNGMLNGTSEELNHTQQNLQDLQASITPAIRFFTRINNLRHASTFWLKSNIKGTPLAPPLFWINARIQRLTQVLRHLPYSRQNGPAINTFVSQRGGVLLSPEHIQWLTNTTEESDLPAIDISIVTHNSAKWLPAFLESLLSLDYPANKLDITFVDNNSSDNTPELLKAFQKSQAKLFASINIIRQANLGFGMGHHTAISAGKNPFILITNVDLTLEPDALKKVIARALSDSTHTASWELRQKPYEHPKYLDPVTLDVNWSSHACILIRRTAYEHVGGYEPRIFMYGEDVELSYRLRAHGYSLRYVPNAVAWHYSYSTASEIKPIQFSGSTLANAYLRLRYGNWSDIAAILPLQFALLVRGGGFSGSRKMVAKNILALARNTPYFLRSRPPRGHTFFPFRAFDYEMRRGGAFFKLQPLEGALPLVSVITRTHGPDARHLKECIASVMNQTYPNIEHIIVEDGGTTKKEVIEEVTEKYRPNAKLAYHPLAKVGRSAAGNHGMSKAKGEFLLLLDEDDLLFPDHIETLYNTIHTTPNINAAYSLAWDVETVTLKDGNTGFYHEVSHSTPSLFYQEFSLDILKHHNYIPIQSILFRSKLFEQHGGFDESMDHLEDWDLWKKYAALGLFKWVQKTTSLFHTPHDIGDRVRRQIALDNAYKHAVVKHHNEHSSQKERMENGELNSPATT